MVFCEHIAERTPHRLEIRARAMQHHDRQAGIARTDVDDVKRRALDLDHPSLRRKGALHGEDSGLRDQRQQRQRRHD